jgi:hypothetical protein
LCNRYRAYALILRSSILSHPLLTAPIGKSLLEAGRPDHGRHGRADLRGDRRDVHLRRLGTDALAGFALVFPLMMMMTMMAAGGMGGGVAAAMARGDGRRPTRGC